MVPIAIVAIIVAFIAVDMIIQHIKAGRGDEVYGFFMPDPPAYTFDAGPNFSRVVASLDAFGIRPPSNVFLHGGHTWISMEDSGEARIGVDGLARKAIGKVDTFDLPEVGQAVRQGERLFSFRQGNRTAEFAAPIDGTVTHLNKEGLRREDPSEWVCKVTPSNFSKNLGALKIAEDGAKWIYEELLRLQELVVMQMPRLQTVGVTMQDGPLALDNLLESMDDEAWNIFQEDFLKGSADTLEEK